MNSTGSNLTIWKTKNIADLENAEKKVVWTPPATGPYSKELWAPELHFLDGKWYIYFAADEGHNENHRIYVVENASRDPLEGEWTFKGKLADASDKWAIDATVFEAGGKTFAVWSGWEGDSNGVQGLYIARMKNPWTIEGPRVRLSVPDHPWEKVGDFDSKGKVLALPHVDVNEGPEILQHEGKVFLIYSASGCWTDYYSLGMLEASKSSDLMNPLHRGGSRIGRCSGRIPRDRLLGRGIILSSSRWMVSRTGLCTTRIRSRIRAVAIIVLRACSRLRGSRMGRRILGGLFRWIRLFLCLRGRGRVLSEPV